MGDIVSITSLRSRRGMRRAQSAVDHYERGVQLEATDVPAAMAAYLRATAGRPELADAYNNLGRLHHDRGELGDAESLYRLAICADASVALYGFNLGVALEDAGRRAEAIAAYERAIEIDAAFADAHFNLARLFERAGQLERAVRHLARYRALRHQPIFK